MQQVKLLEILTKSWSTAKCEVRGLTFQAKVRSFLRVDDPNSAHAGEP